MSGLLILWAAVAVVLVIGCVNIAALMLAPRCNAKGARWARGLRLAEEQDRSFGKLFTTESLVLGFAGGVAGLGLGYAAIQALQTLIADYGIWQDLRLDSRVLLATVLLTFAVSLLFGLAPAFQAARVDVRTTILEGGSRGVAGGGSHWIRRALVLAEVSMTLVLLVAAGLLIRTLLHLQHLDPGFDGTNVITATASLQDARYNDGASVNRLFRDSLGGIEKIPGVEAAAVGLHLPYQRWLNSGAVVRSGSASRDTEVETSMNYVTPEYFKALHIPLRSGRVFVDQDSESSSAEWPSSTKPFARRVPETRRSALGPPGQPQFIAPDHWSRQRRSTAAWPRSDRTHRSGAGDIFSR